jgi:hypothetical protein
MSEETFDVQAAIEAMARVEEFNDQFRQPNPRGRYPVCKPILYNAEYCAYCRNWIKGVLGPCPAVPPEQRWGETYKEQDG